MRMVPAKVKPTAAPGLRSTSIHDCHVSIPDGPASIHDDPVSIHDGLVSIHEGPVSIHDAFVSIHDGPGRLDTSTAQSEPSRLWREVGRPVLHQRSQRVEQDENASEPRDVVPAVLEERLLEHC